MLFSPKPSGTLKLGPTLVIEVGLYHPVKQVLIGLVQDRTPQALAAHARGQEEFRGAVELTELSEEGLGLDVPAEFCNQGETLRIDLRATGGGLPDEIRARMQGKVMKQSFDPHNRSRVFVQIQFLQHDASIWGALRARLNARQEAVARVFERIRE